MKGLLRRKVSSILFNLSFPAPRLFRNSMEAINCIPLQRPIMGAAAHNERLRADGPDNRQSIMELTCSFVRQLPAASFARDVTSANLARRHAIVGCRISLSH